MVVTNLVTTLANTKLSERAIEYWLWILFALIINGAVWIGAWMNGGFSPFLLIDNYVTIIIGIMIAISPVLCAQIFGKPPFQLLRDRVTSGPRRSERHTEMPTISLSEGRVEFRLPEETDVKRAKELSGYDAITLLSLNAASSDRLSRNIYTRAGVYMMTGALVAFSGLLFFYFQTAALTAQSDPEITQIIISIAPKFGILIFIEIVAFFFLRQYRAAMDEFRYFEAIKRRREETLVLVKLNGGAEPSLTVEQILDRGAFSSGEPTLGKEQTTELLEARKLEKNELAIVEKLIDALAHRKGP